MDPFSILSKFKTLGLTIFSLEDFRRVYPEVPKDRIKYFIETYTKKRLFIRLKQGLYALEQNLPSDNFIANRLYQPSYISLEYALNIYNIMPEVSYSITNITTKPTRIFTINDKAFTYTTIKKQAYTGYSLKEISSDKMLIAEPEKALVDYLYLASIGKKVFNDRLELSQLDRNKLLEYATLFNRDRLVKLVEEL